MKLLPSRDQCLDHDHITGVVRGVLCRNCNGIEGKIHNLARRGSRQRGVQDFVDRLQDYWRRHFCKPEIVYHPDHKTDDEKRIARNNKARVARATAKAKANLMKG